MNNFVDNIFAPPLNMIAWIQDKLNTLTISTAKGIDLSAYFGWIGWLGPEWVTLVQSIISGGIFLAVLYSVSTMSSVYMWFKDLIKWW